MESKTLFITLIVSNVVLLAIIYLLTQTTFFSFWYINESTPRVCVAENADGEQEFIFCPVEAE